MGYRSFPVYSSGYNYTRSTLITPHLLKFKLESRRDVVQKTEIGLSLDFP